MKSNASTSQKIGWVIFKIDAIYMFGLLSVDGGKQ